jgi:hypothetical protein
MCDDAENLAGTGTDVRRCSDALGPRKNLHMNAPFAVGQTGISRKPHSTHLAHLSSCELKTTTSTR